MLNVFKESSRDTKATSVDIIMVFLLLTLNTKNSVY